MVTQLVKNSEKKYDNVIKVWPFYSNLHETKKKYFLEINEKEIYLDFFFECRYLNICYLHPRFVLLYINRDIPWK